MALGGGPRNYYAAGRNGMGVGNLPQFETPTATPPVPMTSTDPTRSAGQPMPGRPAPGYSSPFDPGSTSVSGEAGSASGPGVDSSGSGGPYSGGFATPFGTFGSTLPGGNPGSSSGLVGQGLNAAISGITGNPAPSAFGVTPGTAANFAMGFAPAPVGLANSLAGMIASNAQNHALAAEANAMHNAQMAQGQIMSLAGPVEFSTMPTNDPFGLQFPGVGFDAGPSSLSPAIGANSPGFGVSQASVGTAMGMPSMSNLTGMSARGGTGEPDGTPTGGPVGNFTDDPTSSGVTGPPGPAADGGVGGVSGTGEGGVAGESSGVGTAGGQAMKRGGVVRPSPKYLADKLRRGGKVNTGDHNNNTDDVPVKLTRGEMVVNKKATQQFQPQLQAMNQMGLPGGGGMRVGRSKA